LTGYFERLVAARLAGRVQVVTPAAAQWRGAALSLRLLGLSRDRARAVFDGMRRRAILPDWREPDVIRAAPVPFYNSFDDVWRCVDALHAELHGEPRT
jgi:kynureninase